MIIADWYMFKIANPDMVGHTGNLCCRQEPLINAPNNCEALKKLFYYNNSQIMGIVM